MANKLQLIRQMFGKDFADEFEEESFVPVSEEYISSITSGSHVQYFDNCMLQPSGSSVYNAFDGGYSYISTGNRHDHPKYALWKCAGCGHVYDTKETLECTHCGHPITEKSRFILE